MGFIAPKNIYGNSLLGFVPPINNLALGQPSTATLLSSLLIQPPATHRWFFVRRRFNQFLENLKITADQAEDGETKHKGVVASLNQAYWGYRDETANRILIGSWGKTTRVRPPRDVDILFILPNELIGNSRNVAATVSRNYSKTYEAFFACPTPQLTSAGTIRLWSFPSLRYLSN
jgi:hypothetical protein